LILSSPALSFLTSAVIQSTKLALRLLEPLVHGIGAAARVVQGHDDDAVGALLPAQRDFCSVCLSHDSLQTLSRMAAMPIAAADAQT